MKTDSLTQQLLQVLDEGVKELDLSENQLREILKVSKSIKDELKANLTKYFFTDHRFGPVMKQFDIEIPLTYNYYTQIDNTVEKAKSDNNVYYCNNHICSVNFSKTSHKFVAGKKYRVKLFPILKSVSTEECLDFLSKHNAVLMGCQGITILYDIEKEQLPKNKWGVSLDEKDYLWKDNQGDHGIVTILARTDEKYGLEVRYYENDLRETHYLICFLDLV